MIKENGKWNVVPWGADKVAVCSNDFTHDACLVVTGDFEDMEQQTEYAKEIARRLSYWEE